MAAVAPGDGGAGAGWLQGALSVKLEWADAPSERMTAEEEAELAELCEHYVVSDHALPAPNGVQLRVRTGQALARKPMSLLQKHYKTNRLHEAVTELLGLKRNRTALLMLRAVRHCELNSVEPGWKLPSADFFGRSPATRVGTAEPEVTEIIDLTADDPDFAQIEVLILDGPLATAWELPQPAEGTPPSRSGPGPRAAVKAEAAAAVPARARGAAAAPKRKAGGQKAKPGKRSRAPWEGESDSDEAGAGGDSDGSEDEDEPELVVAAPQQAAAPTPVEPSVAAAVRKAYQSIADMAFDEPGAVGVPLRFAARYAREAGVPDEAEAAANIREYRRYLAIKAVIGAAVPPPTIDAVYHMHLIFTQSYQRFCDAMGHGFVHHGARCM